MYLLILDDTHTDPSYELFLHKDKAIAAAQKTMSEVGQHYKLCDGDWDICQGDYRNWWWSAQTPCGSARVTLEAIKSPLSANQKEGIEAMYYALSGCSNCEYDEAEGLLYNHCEDCQHRITCLAFQLFSDGMKYLL